MTIIFTIITFIIEWYLCKWVGNKLNFRQPITVKNTFVALVTGILSFGVGLLAILPTTSNSTHPNIFTATLKTNLGFLIVISSIIIGPILEELLFQGAIQKGFFKKLNPWFSIVLTAVIFAACHNIAWNLKFLSKVIAGVLYGYTYQKTNDIKMAVLSHGINNLIVTILLYIQVFS
ncbi:CPBP family intramembrane glutamic endopeptidase [Lactobacillus sp. LL6]|uniref:CPBP family intramembrane glutamic endopeptidase n=1 Tax=Lactobacillus sp. LL6 TaxID=2596827 RepID=UPI001F5BDAF9|nr:CPBP family intramembrane glutamic endopeptidase [Lactobacillus sp. LL6]